MNHLFRYRGTVRQIGNTRGRGKSNADIVLGDIDDSNKAPIRIEAFGSLAAYINGIECTDAEERYIKASWYYGSSLFLHRIEIPSSDTSGSAKIITQADPLSGEIVVIFGPQEYIESDTPEPMTRDQYSVWLDWKINH